MQYANIGAERLEAFKGAKGAVCPLCGCEVVPKVGAIIVHHWAHKSRLGCDPHSEPETPWHRRWKGYFPESNREVVYGNHRADVMNEDGSVFEFQNSSISIEKIRDRNRAYGRRLKWIINASTLAKNLEFTLEKDGLLCTLWWKHHSGAWKDQRIAFDLSEKHGLVFDVMKDTLFRSSHGRWYAKGHFMETGCFVRKIKGSIGSELNVQWSGLNIASREERDEQRCLKYLLRCAALNEDWEEYEQLGGFDNY